MANKTTFTWMQLFEKLQQLPVKHLTKQVVVSTTEGYMPMVDFTISDSGVPSLDEEGGDDSTEILSEEEVLTPFEEQQQLDDDEEERQFNHEQFG